MRRLLKWTARIVLGLAAILAVAAGAIYLHWTSSVPDYAGRYEMAGLAGPVSIVRDKHGIPYIRAGSPEDAAMALGFVHAQDRLFQMDMNRRIGQGRLAEVTGSPGLGADRLMRTLGLYRRAEADVAALSPEMRRLLEAYARGVNFYLENRREALPPEYLALPDPEPWKPADSLVWGKIMALGLATGWRDELLRAKLTEAIGAQKAAIFFPPYPEDGPTTLPRERASLPPTNAGALYAALPEFLRVGGLSNEWVVAGGLTASGKPILANDPHLSLEAPTLWYLARVEMPGLTLTGATVAGVPVFILGHNGRIAWGVTTPYVDAEDLFIEKIDPADPQRYFTPDGPKAFVTRQETIKVRFGGEVTMTVRETRHGPVIDDALQPASLRLKLEKDHVLALRAAWLSPGDSTPDALWALNRARNWDEFRAALARYVAPAQNFVYADIEGNIGYLMPGRIPIRKTGRGTLPVPGWTGEGDWLGYIPFDKLPQAFNPPRGFVVNANNRIAGADYPYHLTERWGDRFRARRIETLLGQGGKLDADRMAAIQGDHHSLMAQEVLPHLLAFEPKSQRVRAAHALLKAWDFAKHRDRPEPLIFMAWMVDLSRRLTADKLGPLANDLRAFRDDVVLHILTKHRDWCDDAKTAGKEDCAARLSESLEAVLADLSARYGDDMKAWRWGVAHRAEMRHRLFSFLPVLRGIGTLTAPADGGPHTVNKADMNVRDARAPLAARHGPGIRAIYTFDDLGASRFVLSTGPSGHPFSPFYGSMLKDWSANRHIVFARSAEEAAKGGAGTTELVPKR